MQTIEGPRFSALTNLASDFRTFLRILADQPEVQALAHAMKSKPVELDVFKRVLDLAGGPVEGDYEHPADAAMAAYVWLLGLGDSEYSEIAAATVLDCKQCWWSRKSAEQVRKATRFHSRAGLVSSVLPAGAVAVNFTAHGRPDVITVPTWAQIVGRWSGAAAAGGIIVYAVKEADIPGLFKNHEAGHKEVSVGK
jgi:hypothetical protein